MTNNGARYRGCRVAFLTQHGKEDTVGEVLDIALGCRVERVTGYDTDLLGTFTRDIPRIGTQIEAARKKARIGMELARLPFGLASEGSFGPDPYTGLLPWNVEILIWIDNEYGLEIVATSQGKTNLAHAQVMEWEEAEAFAEKSGFPEHHLIVRPDGSDDLRFRKGINDWKEFKEAFLWAAELSDKGMVFIETDMRAHANPTRMNNIRLAAEELAQKLTSACPVCGAPGYWIIERIRGLPCSCCAQPTRDFRSDVYGCSKCSHRVTLDRADRKYADPGHCDSCNP